MVEWLKLSDEQRRTLIRDTAYEEGIREEAVEKDWWVSLVLKALFTSKYKDYIIFKGGTSLSKCWKLIERFSEDIDIALSSEAFGMKYEENPTNSFLNKLRKFGYEFTSNDLKIELEKQFIALGLPKGAVIIEAEAQKDGVSYPDPETLYIVYNSLYEKNEYLPNVVKVEVSVRSLKEPNAVVGVRSIMGEIGIYPELPFDVIAVEPKRTFLEKMFLLHEEFQKPDASKVRSKRMSRHLYDLEKMMDMDPGIQALADDELYTTIIKHRSTYTKLPGVNYNSHKKQTISFIPPDSIIEAYSKDYQTMREIMIYRESISFDELIKRLKILTKRFRTDKSHTE